MHAPHYFQRKILATFACQRAPAFLKLNLQTCGSKPKSITAKAITFTRKETLTRWLRRMPVTFKVIGRKQGRREEFICSTVAWEGDTTQFWGWAAGWTMAALVATESQAVNFFRLERGANAPLTSLKVNLNITSSLFPRGVFSGLDSLARVSWHDK